MTLYVPERKVWTKQPQSSCVNFSHPLAPKNGFVVATVGGILRLFTSKDAAGLKLGHIIKPSPVGEGFGLTTVNDAVSPVSSVFPVSATPTKGSTMLFQAHRSGTPSIAERIFEVSIGTPSFALFWNNSLNKWVYSVPFATTNMSFSIDNSSLSGDVYAVQHDGSNLTNGLAWVNGLKSSTTSQSTASGAIVNYSNQSLYVANRVTNGRGFLGAIQFIYYDNEIRSESEIVELSKNPWQIFAPRRQWFAMTPEPVTTRVLQFPNYAVTGTGVSTYQRQLPGYTWSDTSIVTNVRLLYPSSDISTGSWTPSTGTTLYAVLDEVVADNSDYIEAVTPTSCEIKLEAGATPLIKTNHTLKYTLLSGSGSITVKLVQGTSVIKTWNHTLTGSAQNISSALSEAEAQTITNYADLRVRLET